MLAAVACYVMPLGMVPLAHTRQGVPEWRPVSAWAGGDTVLLVRTVTYDDVHRLYAIGASSGLWVSDDQGEHWLRSDRGLLHDWTGGVDVVDLAIHPANGNEIYALIASSPARPRPMLYWSQNGGQTWEPRGSLGPRRLHAIGFSPSGEDLYMVTANDVMRAFVQDLGRRHFFRGPQDEERALVASLGSRQRASTLVAVPNDAVGQQVGGARKVSAPITLYVGTLGDGLRVLNGDGDVLSLQESPDADTQYVRQHAMVHVVCYCNVSSILYVGTDQGVYASKDGGGTWYHTAYELRDRAVYALLIDPDTQNLYAGVADGGIYASVDDGATWQHLGVGLGHASVFSLAMDHGQDVLYAGTDRGLWGLSRVETSSAQLR